MKLKNNENSKKFENFRDFFSLKILKTILKTSAFQLMKKKCIAKCLFLLSVSFSLPPEITKMRKERKLTHRLEEI